MMRNLRNAPSDDLAPSKYDALQKGYHAATAVTMLVALSTGLVMLAKIDTVLWNRNPQILTDQTWGVIYVLHGAAAMVILFLFLIHIYFALIPEHRAFLKAMIAGRGPGHARGNHR
jgi:cytochrome b subunit of formate dehydrogenase